MAPPKKKPPQSQEPTYRPWWHRLPVSIIISVVFLLGAYRIAVTDNGLDGVAMIVVGILLTGVWITIELHDKFYGEHQSQYYICPDPSIHGEDEE